MGALFFGDERERLVDALHTFHIHRQRIQKDVGKRVPRNLRKRRVVGRGVGGGVVLGFVHAACADHQNALGPQVDGWGNGRGLPHGAVAKVFDVVVHLDALGRKNERNG